MRPWIMIGLIMLLVTSTSVVHAKMYTLLDYWEDEALVGTDVTSPRIVTGGCDAYANCHDLRNISLHDYDVTEAAEQYVTEDTDSLRLVVVRQVPYGATIWWRACWYDDDYNRLGCFSEGSGHLQVEFTTEARHVRLMLETGVQAEYRAALWAMDYDP